jgi:hypothetical protein
MRKPNIAFAVRLEDVYVAGLSHAGDEWNGESPKSFLHRHAKPVAMFRAEEVRSTKLNRELLFVHATPSKETGLGPPLPDGERSGWLLHDEAGR